VNRPVFFLPGKPGIIDTAHQGEDGELRSDVNKQTLAEMRARFGYEMVQVGELEDVARASEDAVRTAPVEVNEERWMDMLEVLPPLKWTGRGGTESFRISEMTYNSVTTTFVRIGKRYFEMSERVTVTHEDLVAAVRAAFPGVQ
jgi:hypothetical protein